ncbi:MAG: thiamine phosphate synthase [Actinomycetota bacterium]
MSVLQSSTLVNARLYLVAPFSLAAGDLPDLVPDLAGAGVDVIQLREKQMEAREMLDKASVVARVCAESQVPFIVNDRVDVAASLQARGLDVGAHVGQGDLSVADARALLGPNAIVGLSTHAPEEVDAATSVDRPDYIAVGPVYETPTKPGRPAAGLSLLGHATGQVELPWFAIGGIDSGNLDEVIEAGARRIVVVRAIALADDPVAAARELAERLAVAKDI